MWVMQLCFSCINPWFNAIMFKIPHSLLHSTCHNWQPWTSCQIRKIAGAHAPGMPRTFSPWPQVSDPDMHHGTCVTHVPWCMPGSLTSGFLWNRRRGGNVPGIPGACATCNFTYLERGPWFIFWLCFARIESNSSQVVHWYFRMIRGTGCNLQTHDQ